jgi:hypothetical protein
MVGLRKLELAEGEPFSYEADLIPGINRAQSIFAYSNLIHWPGTEQVNSSPSFTAL